jgi:hypothetical protein
MENPLEKKRRGYLSFFCDGVIDAVAHRELDIKKKSSAYYKQGYDFGLTFRDALTKEDLKEIKQEKK